LTYGCFICIIAAKREKESLMAGGYLGKLFFVDLATGKIEAEVLDENLGKDFIGGYGIGARILYSGVS
jgi:aldehyde:ferredoxin oxidoreductase